MLNIKTRSLVQLTDGVEGWWWMRMPGRVGQYANMEAVGQPKTNQACATISNCTHRSWRSSLHRCKVDKFLNNEHALLKAREF